MGYYNGVVAAHAEQQAAIYGNVYANESQQRLDTEAKLGINLDDFDKAEQDFLIALAAGGAGGPSPAIGGAGAFIPFTPPKS